MNAVAHPIFPSILSTNFFNLESRLKIFEQNKIDFIHLDVMDGHFVDNLSFGPSAAKAIKSAFDFRIDAHLMVSNPSKMIPWFINAGSEWVSFHVETGDLPGEDIAQNIALIKNENRKAGLVLNPDTPVERVFPYLGTIDYVLLMSVFPGYGGQTFITDTVDRVTRLRAQINDGGHQCMIQVDGGVNDQWVGPLKKAGADLFVVGTFLFNADNVENILERLLNNMK